MDKMNHIFTLREICEMLIEKTGVKEGYWTAIVEFQMGATFAAPEGGAPIPTAMVGVNRIGLQPAEPNHPQAVNAATIGQPAKRTRAPRKLTKAQ